MKNKIIPLIALMIIVSGCENKSARFVYDQELRREIFKDCMKLLPEGPKETTYNDWDEVVAECDNVAYYQSRRCVENCE